MDFDITQVALPTLDRLNATIPDDVDAEQIAQRWFGSFEQHAQAGNVTGVLRLMLEDAFWRDILALTWDMRTFYTTTHIRKFLEDRLTSAQISSLKLDVSSIELQRPYNDIAWIQAFFTFDTPIGHASGIVRLVPSSQGPWLAHAMLTNLESLRAFPEQIGMLREQEPNHGRWQEKRKREIECLDEDPKVVVIGGGRSGLEIAARLKYQGIKTLVVEKESQVGYQWRKRYEALCLHDPVCKCHTTVHCDCQSRLTHQLSRVRSHAIYSVGDVTSAHASEIYQLDSRFPPTWPVYCPAPKVWIV